MDENSVIILCDKLLKRYERPLGIMFLYNTETDKIWAGNEAALDVLRLIDGKRTIFQIVELLKKDYEDFDLHEVHESVFSILKALHNKDIVTII